MAAAYRNGGDPQRTLSLLATWLGHTHVADTYWYLTEGSGIASDGRRLPGSAAMQAA
jgi:sugar phosphate isomerase/epimerase